MKKIPRFGFAKRIFQIWNAMFVDIIYVIPREFVVREFKARAILTSKV